MNIRELRLLMRDMSGRYDLVSDEGSDLSRANFFLNSGIRHLDRICTVKKSVARYFAKKTVGQYLVTFTGARALHTVWVADAEGRYELTPKPLSELLTLYPKQLTANDNGAPLYWAPAYLRPMPESWTAGELTALGDLVNYLDVMPNNNYAYNGILIMPPLDGTYLVEVWGKWYSSEMQESVLEAGIVEDPEIVEGQISTNYWSTQYPELVVMAAMRMMEVFNRNMQGSKELDVQIQMMVDDVEKDLVEEENANIDQMKG